MSESDSIIPKPPTVCSQLIACFLPIASVAIVCSVLIASILSIASLAIGAVYQYDCPRQPLIPIYLMVIGVFGLLLAVLPILPYRASYGDYRKAFSCLFTLFYVCWFIAGNVWIYSIYQPNYNKTTTSIDPYCNKTLYLYAFWTTNLNYIILGLLFLYACCSLLLWGEINPTNL